MFNCADFFLKPIISSLHFFIKCNYYGSYTHVYKPYCLQQYIHKTQGSIVSKKDHIHEVLLQYALLMARIAATHEADQALREDLLQDISLTVWHSVENFRGDSSMKTFIAKVAHNRAVDHVLKETRRQDRHNLSDPLLDLVSTDSHQHSDNTYDLMTAMRRLPLKFRQVISLQLEGFNQAEIAHTLGLNEANVAKRASRARVQLQKLMEQ